MVLYLPNGDADAEIQDTVISKLASLPDALRLSLTWEQGNKLVQNREITSKLRREVYFCDTHSP